MEVHGYGQIDEILERMQQIILDKNQRQRDRLLFRAII